MYIPKRLFISPQAREFSRTNDIIARIKKLNKNIEIIYIDTQTPDRPTLSPDELYNYLKESLIICTRSNSAKFMETFASPGKIAENLGVNGKIYYHCPLRCQFCYLDSSGNGTRWNRVYVDWERFKAEAIKEILVNRIALTLWSAISFLEKKPLDKLPANFKEICDKTIRKDVLLKWSIINSDKSAISYLKKNLKKFLNVKVGIKNIKQSIPIYYDHNLNKELWINLGEYSDLISINHITNFLTEVTRWVQEDNGLMFSFRTKCAILERAITLPANNRIKITMNLNTQSVIDKYELGTSSLDERIKSINGIIARGDIIVQLAIEPIIKYENYKKEYKQLVKRIVTEIDLTNVRSIKFGTVRYKSALITTIKKNIPHTDLFNEQNLVEPKIGDNKWRYSSKERISIYNSIIKSFGKSNHDKLGLAAEDPDIWDAVGLNKAQIHNDIVYQYSDDK